MKRVRITKPSPKRGEVACHAPLDMGACQEGCKLCEPDCPTCAAHRARGEVAKGDE